MGRMACGFNIFERGHNLVQILEIVDLPLINLIKIFYFSFLIYKVEIMLTSASKGNPNAFTKKKSVICVSCSEQDLTHGKQ